MGSQALLALQQSGGPKRKLVGLEMIDRGIARDGYKVCSLEGEPIGYVTSGSPSPYLKKNIALAYVPVASHRAGNGSGGRGAREPGQGQGSADAVLPPTEKASAKPRRVKLERYQAASQGSNHGTHLCCDEPCVPALR